MCSPPPRGTENQEHIWTGLSANTFHVLSSDHAAFKYDDVRGKKLPGADKSFRKIPNGVPGVETRLPLLFSEGVNKGRITLQQFVAISSTNAAKIYGLHPRKGTIAVGADADIVLWDPTRKVSLTNSILHHNCDYTPYEGRELTGYPVMTLSRGEVVMEEAEDERLGRPRPVPEMRPARGGAPARQAADRSVDLQLGTGRHDDPVRER